MWLYYVLADEQGNHAFSVTIDQFNADVQTAQDAGLL
jgi:cell division protein YceG involved in septum cleavage